MICPAIVREYNHHMGSVDLFDMLMSLYKVDHKSRQWYRRIFYWLFNVAIVNGWQETMSADKNSSFRAV